MIRNTGSQRFFSGIGLVTIGTVILLSALPTLGQEVKRIEPVVVTATRLEEPLEQVPSTVTVVSEEEIQTRQYRTVEEILRSIPGVDVQRSGSLGKLTTVRIRGANPTQIQVLIDGVRVKSPTTGDFDFGDLTVDNIERIEVVRGPQSTLYGADAIGGVINIITKKGTGKPKFSVSFEGGNFETFRERASLDGTVGKADYALAFSRTDTNGQFDNDQYNNTTFSGRVGYQVLDNARLSFIARYMNAEKGIPFDTIFPDFDPEKDRSQEDDFLLLTTQWEHAVFPWWDYRLRLSTVDSDLTFKDPPDVSQIDINRKEVEWQNNFHYKDLDTLTVGFEWRKEKGTSENFFFGFFDVFDRSVTLRSFFAQNQLRLFQRLFLTAGVRVDDHSTFGTEVTPRVAAAYLLQATGTKFRASYGEGFRAPTLNELFFPGFGNPNLQPEESKSWDVGFEQRLFQERLRFGVTYFRNDFKNLIQTIEVSPGIFAPENVGRARTEGVEMEVALEPVRTLSIAANYTYLEPKDRITNQELRRFARNRWNISATYRPIERLTTSLIVHVVSSQFESTLVGRNEGYTRVDLAASYDLLSNLKPLENLQLFGRIENLLDEDYQEVFGFPALGLNFLIGLKARF